jgi:hypothetical protein
MKHLYTTIANKYNYIYDRTFQKKSGAFSFVRTKNFSIKTNLGNHHNNKRMLPVLLQNQKAFWNAFTASSVGKISLMMLLGTFAFSTANAQCTRSVSNTPSNGCGSTPYVFFADGERWQEISMLYTECGTKAYLTGTMKRLADNHTWSINV